MRISDDERRWVRQRYGGTTVRVTADDRALVAEVGRRRTTEKTATQAAEERNRPLIDEVVQYKNLITNWDIKNPECRPVFTDAIQRNAELSMSLLGNTTEEKKPEQEISYTPRDPWSGVKGTDLVRAEILEQVRKTMAEEQREKNEALARTETTYLPNGMVITTQASKTSPYKAAMPQNVLPSVNSVNQKIEEQISQTKPYIEAIQRGDIPDLPQTTDPVLKSVFERLTTPEGIYSAGIENREDFAKMSQPVRLEAPEVEKTAIISHSPSMTKEAAMRATRLTNQIDPLYDYINNIDGYRDLNANHVQTEFSRYDHLEESERKIYTYLYRSEGKEAAEAYLNTLANALTDRMIEANEAVIRQNIEDMPWLAPVYAIGSVPTNLIGGAVGAVDMLWQTVKNGEVDINSDAQRFARYGRTVRSIATEDMGTVGKFFTDTILSAAESGLAALLPGGTIALAASAGTATAQETIQRGGSAWQALAAGGAAAIFEGLFEKLSISNLEALQQVKPETVKQVIGELGKTVLVNFEEELATEAANIAFDALFLGDASAWNQSMEAYHQQGKSDAEAFWATMKDNAIQTALAGVSGAVMGGMFGAASTPGMYTRSHITRESVENRDTAQEITESGQYPFDHTGKRTVKEIPTVAQTVNLSSEDLGKPRAAIFDNSIVREDSFVPKPATGLPTDLTAKVEAQRAAGGGVVSDGIPAWMTSREKRALNAVAQSQQLVVRFASEGELSAGTLGYLDGDTIVLSPESKQPVLDTYIHEVTHALKQTAPESYRQYQQGILDILGDETLNSRTQIAVEKLRERYEATSGEVSESQLNDELTAEFTSWVLQTNVQTLENIAGIHRNVFQRVYDALSEVWQRIRLGTSGGEAAMSLKNILGLDLDDVDVERIESTLEALRDVFGESEANVRTVGRSHEAGVPSYRLAEQGEILSNEGSEKGFTNGISRGTINTESAEGEIGVDTELLKSPEWSAPETGYKYRKPPHSPDINRLLKRKESVKIEPVNNVWTFTMVVGGEQVTVVYKNGEPDFTPYVKAKVKVECTGNRGVDARRADAALWKTENRQPPRGCVRHHTADGMTIQWVPKEIHEKFSHEGFVVKMKRLKKNADNSMEY